MANGQRFIRVHGRVVLLRGASGGKGKAAGKKSAAAPPKQKPAMGMTKKASPALAFKQATNLYARSRYHMGQVGSHAVSGALGVATAAAGVAIARGAMPGGFKRFVGNSLALTGGLHATIAGGAALAHTALAGLANIRSKRAWARFKKGGGKGRGV